MDKNELSTLLTELQTAVDAFSGLIVALDAVFDNDVAFLLHKESMRCEIGDIVEAVLAAIE